MAGAAFSEDSIGRNTLLGQRFLCAHYTTDGRRMSAWRRKSRLLGACRERPRGRAAEQRDEFAAFHRAYPKVTDHRL